MNMERPLSTTSSGTAPSTTSGPTHRRNASSATRNLVRPSGSPAIPLFVTNLRLLDLDQNPDWPHISPSSFSNADSRTRIKHAEYSLYQLFRLWDPVIAADKLQPFFPPLEPLQSINLRAALFRCLTELKKNGALSKEAVLRKTMLDECQGEKFWEVCLSFSAAVLRKVSRERQKGSRSRQANRAGIAERLGNATVVTKGQKESMLPLAIAHRAALTRVLREKQEKREVFAQLHEILVQKEDELVQRRHRSHQLAKRSGMAQSEKLRAVETTIEKNWIGSTDLKDALIDGDTCPKGDVMLLKSFDHFWNGETADPGRRESDGVEIGLLQSLNSRATDQTTRLRKWQHFYDRLTASKPPSARSSRPASQAQKPGLTFSKHRDINLHDISDDDSQPDQSQRKPPPRHASAMRYDDILTAMREELRKNSTTPRNARPAPSPVQSSFHPIKRSQTQPVAPMRKLSVAIDTSAGALNAHVRSPSQTTVPLRSPLGRRVSSRSRSYDKPKVDGQRERIPLKAELFSPLKDPRRSSLSPLSSEYALPSADEDAKAEAEIESKSPASPRDSGLGMKANGYAHDNGIGSNSTDSASASASEAENQVPGLSTRQTNVRPSLAERTRKSMAFTGGENQATSNSSPSPSPSPALSDEHADTDERTKRLDALQARTRQSISLAPPPTDLAPRSKKPTRPRTSTYPVNQFETPQKARSSTVGIREEDEDEEAGRRVVTPMENLMSPEAKYDSIFKSRPKIAVSPVITPRDETRTFETRDVDGGAEE